MKQSLLLLPLVLLACSSEIRPHVDRFPILSPNVCIDELDKQVRESSGLLFWDGMLWTHNDSGDDPWLYQLDQTSGEVIRQVWVEGASHVDWEEIAQDSAYIYVGDIGNNNGARRDLQIYKIAKAQFSTNSDTVNIVGSIQFSYPEQVEFSERSSHNFDCEAFVVDQDSIFLFTKNRADNQTVLYALPTEPGEYKATWLYEFDVAGTLTGADYDATSGRLVMTGYNWESNPWPFVWVFSDIEGHDFLTASAVRHNLEPSTQVEAICFIDADNLYLSCEQRRTPEARLYCVSIAELE